MSHIGAERSGSHLDHSKPIPARAPEMRASRTSSARFVQLGLAAICVLAALVTACSPPPKPVRARSIAALLADKIPVLRPPQQNVADDKRRFKDAPVYI